MTTSVPDWAEQELVADVDDTGREIVIVAVSSGPPSADAHQIVTGWQARAHQAGLGYRAYSCDSPQAARQALYGSAARVGWRLMITGTGADCAVVRAAALELGWLDAEIRIGSTDTSQRQVSCAHCGATNLANVRIDQVLCCVDCGRNLIVHHHFSRRSGTYLGYQADAEDGGND